MSKLFFSLRKKFRELSYESLDTLTEALTAFTVRQSLLFRQMD